MNNLFYFESSKLPFNCQIDADICKLKALKGLIKESEDFTGRLETDYLDGIDHCIELLDFMRVCEYFLIKKENPGNTGLSKIHQEIFVILFYLTCRRCIGGYSNEDTD